MLYYHYSNSLPIRPEIAGSVDEGTVEYVKAEFLEKAAEAVEKL